MKSFWVRADGKESWEKRKKLVTIALESGADAVIVNAGEEDKTRQLGRISAISDGAASDIFISSDLDALKKSNADKKAYYKDIKNKEDEKAVASAGSASDYVVVKASDWKVIPLENIIAALKKKAKIIVEVSGKEDAKLALETLEVGADGILAVEDPSGIKKIKEVVDGFSSEKVELKAVKIKAIKPVGMGDRVCVDTCSMLAVGEGMLVGSQSSALFLVHSESLETEYVAARPFRVNAGPVHAYTLMPDGKTKYLSELSSGDEVLAVDSKGHTRTVVVGRMKIEKRPLMLLEAECPGHKIKTLLQNAETIRLVEKDGKPVSITSLKEGDEVLAYVEDVGRHFGMKIEETIQEK